MNLLRGRVCLSWAGGTDTQEIGSFQQCGEQAKQHVCGNEPHECHHCSLHTLQSDAWKPETWTWLQDSLPEHHGTVGSPSPNCHSPYSFWRPTMLILSAIQAYISPMCIEHILHLQSKLSHVHHHHSRQANSCPTALTYLLIPRFEPVKQKGKCVRLAANNNND